MKQKIDWNLKFLHTVLKLESLHFGYWDGIKVINIENLKLAQKQYIEHLISKIPQNVKTILDVGAGTGEVAKELVSRGYYVESVSPDRYQQEIFKQKCAEVKFHLSKFEDLNLDKKFDLILMAESCQYLNLARAFDNCKKLLNSDGYILICDYFRTMKTNYYRTTHIFNEFMSYVNKNSFRVVYEEDITEQVLPTLILGKQIYSGYVLPVLEIISGYLSDKRPIISKLLKFIFYSQLKKIKYYLYNHTSLKLDTEKFIQFIKYKLILLKI